MYQKMRISNITYHSLYIIEVLLDIIEKVGIIER